MEAVLSCVFTHKGLLGDDAYYRWRLSHSKAESMYASSSAVGSRFEGLPHAGRELL